MRRRAEGVCAYIVESLLALMCRNDSFRAAFIDFSGCRAIQFYRCYANFCGWCVKALDLGDIHEVVGACQHAGKRTDAFFARKEENDPLPSSRIKRLIFFK